MDINFYKGDEVESISKFFFMGKFILCYYCMHPQSKGLQENAYV